MIVEAVFKLIFIFQDKELYGKRKMAVLLAEQVTFFSHIFLPPLALSEIQKKLSKEPKFPNFNRGYNLWFPKIIISIEYLKKSIRL